jgi:hypothetical protein
MSTAPKVEADKVMQIGHHALAGRNPPPPATQCQDHGTHNLCGCSEKQGYGNLLQVESEHRPRSVQNLTAVSVLHVHLQVLSFRIKGTHG